MIVNHVLTHSAPSTNYYYCWQNAKPLLSWDNKSGILGHLSECMGRGSAADVKQPQAVLPIENFTLTLLPASPRPIFRLFCSDAIDILWHYRAETEVDANGVLRN